MSDDLQVTFCKWGPSCRHDVGLICIERGPYARQTTADKMTQAKVHHFCKTLESISLVAIQPLYIWICSMSWEEGIGHVH